MPRPPKETIPEIVRAAAAKRGLTVTAFSESLGHGPNWISRLSSSRQAQLLPYKRFAVAAGLTLDELAARLEGGEGPALLSKLQGAKSIYRLAQELEVSEAFLRRLKKNDGTLNSLKSYVELARAINCQVSELLSLPANLELSA